MVNPALIADVAEDVGTKPIYLAMLINFESNFNARAKNPRSTARGLIQFTDARAQDLGFNNSLELVNKYPTINAQLDGPVRQDLKKYGPFQSEADLYMSVFYPKARGWDLDRQFPEWVTKNNPGIETPRDYVRKVRQHSYKLFAGPLVLSAALALTFLS